MYRKTHAGFLWSTIALSLLLPLLTAMRVQADDDAQAVNTLVRKTVDSVLTVLKDDKLAEAEKRSQVFAKIDPVIDFELMARLALGRTHWGKADAKQRETFTALFVETLRWMYYEKLGLFTDETVEYDKPVPKKNKFYALTYVLSKGDRIKVAYKLYKKDDRWLVYDFEIEGVSTVKLKGTTYAEILQEHNLEYLFDSMRKTIADYEKSIEAAPPTAEKTPEAGR